MKKSWLVLGCILLVARLSVAGVVYEVEIKAHKPSVSEPETSQMSVEGRHLKMVVVSGEARRGAANEMIYRGDRREMIMIDHHDKSYVVMDQQTVRSMAERHDQAMSQLQERLKGVPENQRAMIEQMMKQHMRQTPSDRPGRSLSQLRKTGERAVKAGYPCEKYEIWREDRKLQELWVTGWEKLEGGLEVKPVFEEMANFFKEMKQSFSKGSGGFGGHLEGSFFEYAEQIDGFPVVTRQFDNGTLERQSILRSATRRTLAPAAFEPPAGYKRQEMFRGQ